MIILLIIFFFILRAYVNNAIHDAIADYARAVDSVFFEKDQKIEDLEYRLCNMQTRIEELETEYENLHRSANGH